MAKPVQQRVRLDGDPLISWRAIEIAGVKVSEGGWYGGRTWLTGAEVQAAEKRWALRSYAVRGEDDEYQCGGCRFLAALDSDWGICTNAASEQDGRVVFEHGGCPQNSWLMAQAHPTGKESQATDVPTRVRAPLDAGSNLPAPASLESAKEQ